MKNNFYILSLTLSSMLFLCSACAGTAGRDLGESYFSDTARCQTLMFELVDEWKENGGRFAGSIADVRSHIESDKNSRLSNYIRKTWAVQNEGESFFENKSRKLKNEDFYLIAKFFDMIIGSDPLKDCSINSIDYAIEREILEEGGGVPVRFLETPDDMEWGAHEASGWVYYWIFRRINDEEN